jgi:hypothetical protein
MDIVERLRRHAPPEFTSLVGEAADEIEKLRNYLRMISWSNRRHLTAEGNHTVEGHKLCIRIAKDALKEWE